MTTDDWLWFFYRFSSKHFGCLLEIVLLELHEECTNETRHFVSYIDQSSCRILSSSEKGTVLMNTQTPSKCALAYYWSITRWYLTVNMKHCPNSNFSICSDQIGNILSSIIRRYAYIRLKYALLLCCTFPPVWKIHWSEWVKVCRVIFLHFNGILIVGMEYLYFGTCDCEFVAILILEQLNATYCKGDVRITGCRWIIGIFASSNRYWHNYIVCDLKQINRDEKSESEVLPFWFAVKWREYEFDMRR